MNLADAIRKAAGSPVAAQAEPVFVFEVEVPVSPKGEVVELPVAQNASVEEIEGDVAPTTVVRLELALTPEQLQGLFRTIIDTQRTVLTTREAAGLLRLPQHKIESLAEAQELPGFKIDGKWRFSRAALMDWLALPHEQGGKE